MTDRLSDSVWAFCEPSLIQRESYDLVVVGAGLAGLRAAVDAARTGIRVLLLARGQLCSGASFYPFTDGLGCQLPENDADAQVFLQEVVQAGSGVAGEELYRVQISQIRREIDRLSELGLEPYFIQGRAACFAPRERTICAWNGWDEARRRLSKNLTDYPNLTVLTNADAVRLLTHNGSICGLVALDSQNNRLLLQTPAVILACGGVCGLYRHNLNPADVTGSAASLALSAGARLVNTEFLQFIPGLTEPVYKMLFCEISLWHCNSVTDAEGRPLLQDALPKGLSVEECLRQRSMHAPFTCSDDSRWFDLAMLRGIRSGGDTGCSLRFDAAFGTDTNEFMASARALYLQNGIDLTRQSIRIAPFAHCANGGVLINADGATSVPGLYCAGEAAGGIHGADRHGGVATAAALVFGARSAAAACLYAEQADRFCPTAETAAEQLTSLLQPTRTADCSEPPLRAMPLRKALGNALWLKANVLRRGDELSDLLCQIHTWRQSYSPIADARAGTPLRKALETAQALITAEAMVLAMNTRTESRGGHYREDHPFTDPAWQGIRLELFLRGDKLQIEKIPQPK